ncbi:hypothetical protein P9112_000101 [Eukaryota sp. TZLM1-RC]
MQEGQTLTFNVSFHGFPYTVVIDSHYQRLLIDVQQSTAPNLKWTGEFSAKYIEEYTKKAGSRKGFVVFVDMLKAGLTHSSESVFLDLLTPEDLDRLKQARGQPSKSSSSNEKKDRRYLILTYASQFDRVHYPLPLIPAATPRTREPVSSEASRVESEEETASLRRRVEQLTNENSKLKSQIEREKKSFNNKLTQLERECSQNKEKLRKYKDQESVVRNLRQQVKSLENSLEKERKRADAAQRSLSSRPRSTSRSIGRPISATRKRSSSVNSRPSSRASSRPTSATRKRPSSTPRFDPTAWVEEQKRKKSVKKRPTSKSRPSSAKPSRTSRDRSRDRSFRSDYRSVSESRWSDQESVQDRLEGLHRILRSVKSRL